MIVAEGMIKYRMMDIDTELQWGRNLIVAEGRPSTPIMIMAICFNGAAT